MPAKLARRTGALLLVLLLAGCGSTGTTTTAKPETPQQAVNALNQQTLKTALADLAVKRADLAHAHALKRLHAAEQARQLPAAEERAYRRKEAHYAALERWMRAGAHGECHC